jgi:RNA polymerase sigma factor (sigma-70 family)
VLDSEAQQLLRTLAPQVLGILTRRYRDFAGCEDAVQEALIAAATQWPGEGRPDNPRGWLLRVATRRLTDQIRADTARRLREQLVISLVPADEQIALAADAGANERDDTLALYFMCCHPALTSSSQVALTLRAVAGLTTAEIARAFFVPEATMAQRLTRAKATIRQSGIGFAERLPEDARSRLPAVLRVLYLAFSEGYAASDGVLPVRIDVSEEAVRVTRQLVDLVPGEPEVQGLLALMLLTDARRPARIGAAGQLVPLDAQDRSLWNRDKVAEGTRLLRARAVSDPGGDLSAAR